MNILRTREVWLRKSSCMSDYLEVVHGLECLSRAYKSESGQNFKLALDRLFEGICSDVEKIFDSWVPHFERDTYILCVSEHDATEDQIGRLSMWRAYAETTGVALVLNAKPFLSPSDALKAYTSPVAYMNEYQFNESFIEMATAIERNADMLKEAGRESVQGLVFHMLKFAALGSKHPGFMEEREWRVIYSPKLESSDYLVKDIQVINGIPQPIYKIPLKNIPDKDFVGAEIPELLDRIIIGPSEYPQAIAEAFDDLLSENGIENPMERVVISDIPLR